LSAGSTSGDAKTTLTVDANVLHACLLHGAALRALLAPRFRFYATVRTTWEVSRYLPRLVRQLRGRGIVLTEAALEAKFHSYPIVPLPDSFYADFVPAAREHIGGRDPRDVDILALTLRLDVPLWTNDHDFDGVPGIRVVRTHDLLALL
jgi:predicted nucleic acid-binding protein